MLIGGAENGGAVLTLTPQEWKALQAGKPVTRVTGDSRGQAKITVKLTRPATPEGRWPHLMPAEARLQDQQARSRGERPNVPQNASSAYYKGKYAGDEWRVPSRSPTGQD
jgi:hypothetical protein